MTIFINLDALEKAYKKTKVIRKYWQSQPESTEQFLKLWKAKDLENRLYKLWKAKDLENRLYNEINGFR